MEFSDTQAVGLFGQASQSLKRAGNTSALEESWVCGDPLKETKGPEPFPGLGVSRIDQQAQGHRLDNGLGLTSAAATC
jgi:hypothetical protein